MSELLLDTHLFLWYVTKDRKLSSSVEQCIDRAESVQLSIASAWEIAVKLGLGKLTLDRPLGELMGQSLQREGIELLPITEPDILAYSALPFPNSSHRDPFDRMLVVQAQVRGLTLLTSDPALTAYGGFVSVA